MSIDVCIGNYGYYNEGGLRDAWISLPKTSEEISDFLSAHGLQDPEHEEIYISDYDGVPFGLTGLFSEFTWLEDLNMLARQMEEREGAVEKVQGALDCGIDGPESVIGLMNWNEQADEIHITHTTTRGPMRGTSGDRPASSVSARMRTTVTPSLRTRIS